MNLLLEIAADKQRTRTSKMTAVVRFCSIGKLPSTRVTLPPIEAID